MDLNKFPTPNNLNNEQAPVFNETHTGDSIRFSCSIGPKEVGAVTLTLLPDGAYDVGGLFVDPAQRGKGISSGIIKKVNAFLEKNNALGKLVNMVSGDASVVYEKNNWKKGELKSQGAYGGYEYTYDARKINLKEEFLRPFDEAQVVEQFKSPIPTESSDIPEDLKMFEIYQERCGDYLYKIFRAANSTDDNHEIFFDLRKDLKEKPITELVLEGYTSKTLGRGFDIKHRIARTQEEGISGSSFLHKAEEYMKILKKNNLLDCEFLFARSGQEKVTQWFLRNGYEFGNSEEKKKYELFPIESSEEIILDFKDHIIERDPARIRKEAFDDPEFVKYLHEENGKKVWSVSFNEGHKFFEKYFQYVTLGKKI